VATPLSRLHINGNATAPVQSNTQSLSSYGLFLQAQGSGGATSSGIAFGEGSLVNSAIVSYDNGASARMGLQFHTGNSTTLTPALTITADQTIGMGITAPTARLHVVQTGTADSFRVDDELTDTTPFIINADGRVGIQTSTPSANCVLDINSTTQVIRLPQLPTNTKNSLSNAAGLFCYDSGLGQLSFNNGSVWLNVPRYTVAQFRAFATTTTDLGSTLNVYNKLATGTISVTSDGGDFTSNSEQFTTFRFVSDNNNSRKAKITVNFDYSINGASQALKFGLVKNGTFTGSALTSGTPFDVMTQTSNATSGVSGNVSNVCLVSIAKNDVIAFVVSDGTTTSRTITINNLVIIAEMNF
jgi:hypothetical protein